MSSHELIQQWKNPHTRAANASHPSGDILLEDRIVGAAMSVTYVFFTYGCCKTSMGLYCG
ncbi:hypothetical protein GCM10017673_42450 [Streptosporangium violaceochromogenes]|nr:hypothetical protein GCM10017673_42450 [Streptosporangium violaceochromogenes]